MQKLCPFCLDDVNFTLHTPSDQKISTFMCPACKQAIPIQYVREYSDYPPVVVSVVGFRSHGKTVFLTSLFRMLKSSALARKWPHFFVQAVDEDDLDVVYKGISVLDHGGLPDATAKVFPRPTMIRVTGMPNQSNCTWLCYDTAGECFERPRQMVQYASFLQRAHAVILLISPTDLSDPSKGMDELLNVYTSGMGTLGAKTKHQHLVVAFGKADKLTNTLDGKWQDVVNYLSQGTIEDMEDMDGYIRRMAHMSRQLRQYTDHVVDAAQFINVAEQSFKSVEFCMVSALGAEPSGRKLLVRPSSKRLLDPLLWMMEKSRPSYTQLFRRWRR